MLASSKHKRSSFSPTLLNETLYGTVSEHGVGFLHLKNK
jgi:hypothetical protein